MLSSIGRIVWVGLAFLLSCCVAAFFVVTLGLERFTHATQGTNFDEFSISGGIELLSSALLLTQAMTMIPALGAVVIGEVARIRSVYYYVVAGGLAFVAVPLLARISEAGELSMPAQIVWQIFAAGGFMGGFAYWMLAGRRA